MGSMEVEMRETLQISVKRGYSHSNPPGTKQMSNDQLVMLLTATPVLVQPPAWLHVSRPTQLHPQWGEDNLINRC